MGSALCGFLHRPTTVSSVVHDPLNGNETYILRVVLGCLPMDVFFLCG